MKILHLQGISILEQLQLEEALLRTSNESFCILNEKAQPAIVLGISGKQEELVAKNAPFPLIRRYSGGGTVVVDEETLFVSFLCQKEDFDVTPYPEPILRWSADLYRDIFSLDTFALRENDYVIGEKKCGGNAQCLTKHRWLHHTTFLWDYCSLKMDFLLYPKKTPLYRAGRSHTDFLTKLKEHLPSKEFFFSNLISYLKKHYNAREVSINDVVFHLDLPHRKSTELLSSFAGEAR